MHSAIYTGQIRHRRFLPTPHCFQYRLFMMYLDLAELDSVFRGCWFWSVGRWNLAWLRRADYLGDPAVPLDTAVHPVIGKLDPIKGAGQVIDALDGLFGKKKTTQP